MLQRKKIGDVKLSQSATVASHANGLGSDFLSRARETVFDACNSVFHHEALNVRYDATKLLSWRKCLGVDREHARFGHVIMEIDWFAC